VPFLNQLRHACAAYFAEASDAAGSIFFPAECRVCSLLLTRTKRIPICEQCLASFIPVASPFCEICGQPLQGFDTSNKERLVCRECQAGTFSFDRARSFATYTDLLVRAILLLKYERMEPLGVWFANRMAEVVRREPEALAGDIVVPVPLHRARERERGYNQAELLARPLARNLRLPCRSLLLVRTRPRPEKHVLSLDERWESVRGAFALCKRGRVDKLRVLLVDDVMTTGATLDACSRALRDAGAKSVIGLTAARAVRSGISVSKVVSPRDLR